ncbi:MAG: pitrilysin family protein [Chromatiales bacterium]|jgi:zinc protease
MVVNLMRGLIFLLVCFSLPALATPQIQSWHTSNGAKVLFVEAPDLPMIDVRVVFDAGSARDGDIPGIAMLTNALLAEGAGDWDADQIAERLESVGAELGSDSLRDMAVVSLRSLTEANALNTALDTFAAILARPTFSDTALQRNLQALKILLRQEQQSPSDVASKAFFREMYGEHPYAHPSNGTPESLADMTVQAVQQFHQRYYVGANAVIAIVGAVDMAQAKDIAERVISALPQGQHSPALPKVTAPQAGKDVVIEFPSQQAHILLGQPVLSRQDPDYFALYVGNHVLGGSGLISQLSVEVREKRGLAYSVYSYFSPMRNAGPFMMGAQTKNAQAEQTLSVLKDTLQKYMRNGPSDAELQRSKQNITGGFPLRVASNKDIVQYLAMIGFYDLPLDYLDAFVKRVEAVTVEQIRDAFERRLQPDKLVTVVVGQPGK